ncbi:hypothetical protein ACL6C3_28775 [Capilliphycus salinus ALCB114379]|uniref:hypothetical protein n=1 Tax=Capilliphycus salinus TaxID=2768948 RepID=UPI0039A4BD76
MLIVLASSYDEAARFWVENWTDGDVALLTPKDLSKIGWRHYLGSLEDSTAVIKDEVISVEKITGVLTRLPCVFEQELLSIVEKDRPYVAAEMTAFLGSWLTHLSCPILNRPTPICLMGTNWRPQQWIYAASQAGMSVETHHQLISLKAEPEPVKIPSERVSVTVIGDRYIGEVDPILGHQAKKLAKLAGVELLVVHYNRPEAGAYFIGADLWLDLKSLEITTAILEYFSGK